MNNNTFQLKLKYVTAIQWKSSDPSTLTNIIKSCSPNQYVITETVSLGKSQKNLTICTANYYSYTISDTSYIVINPNGFMQSLSEKDFHESYEAKV